MLTLLTNAEIKTVLNLLAESRNRVFLCRVIATRQRGCADARNLLALLAFLDLLRDAIPKPNRVATVTGKEVTPSLASSIAKC
jgi:hypothetical protein